METINNEYYVSPEVAKLLEKVGFDWECRKCYNEGVLFDMEPDEIRKQTPQHSSYDVSAPTLEVAQRWLREVKQCYVHVYPMFSFEGTLEYYFVEVIYPSSRAIKQNEFNTYEEALEAGIKKALEIINKGE